MSFSKLGVGAGNSDAANFINDRLPWNRGNDPEWLKSIQQGDSPLLGRSEWEYIAYVRRRIIREAKPSPNIPSDRRLRNKLSVMKNNFGEVIKYLKENSECKDYFVRTYPSWRSFRDKSIIQLIDIAEAVDKNHRESAAKRGEGSSVSLVGGLMCLVPGIGALRLAGGVLMGLGSLAAFLTSIDELEKFQKKTKEAEQIMLQDKEYSEKLYDWMNNVSNIEKAYNIIKDMELGVDVKSIASDLHAFYKTSSTPEDLMKIIGKSVLSLKFSPGMVIEIADAIGMFLAKSMLYECYRPMFNLVFEMHKYTKILYKAGNIIATTAKMTSIVNASSKRSALTKSRIGIGIALDIINIIQASNDENNKSKEAIEIVKVAETLEKEAEVFKKVYDAVKEVQAG